MARGCRRDQPEALVEDCESPGKQLHGTCIMFSENLHRNHKILFSRRKNSKRYRKAYTFGSLNGDLVQYS
jgi:hypothetical protein